MNTVTVKECLRLHKKYKYLNTTVTVKECIMFHKRKIKNTFTVKESIKKKFKFINTVTVKECIRLLKNINI
jgi:hypothetical protein